MIFGDTLHYLAVGNPLSKVVIGSTASLYSKASQSLMRNPQNVMNIPPLWKLAGGNYYFLRLAGLSGAAGVMLGAAASHMLTIQNNSELRHRFETANRFHFIHTVVLLGLPLAKYPIVSGTLMALGISLFSGALYYRAFTGNKANPHMVPVGRTILTLAWLSLLL